MNVMPDAPISSADTSRVRSVPLRNSAIRWVLTSKPITLKPARPNAVATGKPT